MPVSIVTKQSKTAAPRKPTRQPELTVVARVIKGDTYMVMANAALEPEDEFVNLYTTVSNDGALALEPPFPPKVLRGLVSHNNILNQCVQAMEVNIDATGHEFVESDPDVEIDKTELATAKSFFDNPYPQKNWVSMRRKFRVDCESIGWGFFEVLRNMAGEVAGIRHVQAAGLRMVRLGESVQITQTLSRNGKDVEFTSNERPRRFMQLVNGVTRQYFKEFGVPLSLNMKTGAWSKTKLPAADEATELIVFGVDSSHIGPYWVPRWINQLPSVIGSRKAENENLEFFDSGGMPPAIIFIQGGQMVNNTADQLRTYLSASNKRKGRAVVVELASNSGSIDSSGTVSARVERFGAEKAGDGMYSKYDQQCEDHVRVGFRLPPLFVGKAIDYTYATAVVAYQVAEAQVFQPERAEFDDLINSTIIKAMGLKTLKFKSLPITLKSIEEKFKGLELVKDSVEGEEFVKEVNLTIDTDLKYKVPDPTPLPVVGNIDPLTGVPYTKPTQPLPLQPAAQPLSPAKPALSLVAPVKKSVVELLSLVRKYAQINGIVDTGWVPAETTEPEQVTATVASLTGLDLESFSTMLTVYARGNDDR